MRPVGISCFLLVAAASSHDALAWTSSRRDARRAVWSPPTSTSLFVSSSSSSSTDSSSACSAGTPTQWANHALLISSFTDGVVNSPDAKSFLKLGLARALAAEQSRIKEGQVRESVMFSPCAGPNIDLLNDLEDADDAVSSLSIPIDLSEMKDKADDTLKRICSSSSFPTYCRILYIPTAMYALNPESKNTPGKQRQRARADGKKRRNLVVRQVQDLVGDLDLEILACTLDLDDGSIKQPVGSDDASLLPKDGTEALSSWKPHLIYVEGGNTFWLQHCIEKGDWVDLLLAACTGPDAYAVYCGKSAGAIVAGSRVDTATWKGWDNPAVVPERETHEDWAGYRGMGFAGEAAIFPHMDDVWDDLVEEKKQQLGAESTVYCLREWEACCVDGKARQLFVTSGEH